MDKTTAKFHVQAFQAVLPFTPSLKEIAKGYKDLANKFSNDKLKEILGLTKEIVEQNIDAYKGSTLNIESVRDAFGKLADAILVKMESVDFSQYESQRGRDLTREVVTFLGKEATIPVHAALITNGSLLGDMLTGEKKDLTAEDYKALWSISNLLGSTIKDSIPEEFRPKRKKRGESEGADSGTANPEGSDSDDTEEEE